MFELIRGSQLNIMLFLCGACGIMALLLLFTRFISKSRRRIIIAMLLIAFFLLWFDRLAYVYAGVPGHKAYIMVRLSNFMVFFLTPGIVLGFNTYLMDWLTHEGGFDTVPRRLKVIGFAAGIGMVLAVVSAFTGLYYYFDETNTYHRGNGFLIAYIIPVLCPLLQYTVIRQYKNVFRKLIYISLILYIFVPIACGILQIFAYGISIVNMSMVAVSISLFIFTYVDINNVVLQAHQVELKNAQGEKEHLLKLFDQTATAFVSAVEKKDDYSKGTSVKVARYAEMIARMSGKDDEECRKVYYAALLHDVGMIGVPDKVIKQESDPDKWDYEAIRKKPLIGREILSSISEYPYLSQGAYYSHERYNGTGYPEGLKGKEIPEIARMIGVADAYVTKMSKKRYRDPRPDFVVREAFIRGAGEEFDPEFAKIMVKIIDSGQGEKSAESSVEVEKALVCGQYRDTVSRGIDVESDERRITFECYRDTDDPEVFSAPSIVLFDSFDKRIHSDRKTIGEYHYLEYGEVWFDDHMITTAARKMVVNECAETGTAQDGDDSTSAGKYEIIASRYEDHMKLKMTGPHYTKEITVALADGSKSVYIGLTGEHCRLKNIKVEPTGEKTGIDDIKRIADEISYIDHLESDLKNVQIDRNRSASTEGMEITNRHRLVFHTVSLPGSSFIWHCPYLVLFYSENGMVDGPGYREYIMIKLNGEDNGSNDYANNRFVMKKTDDFPGWDRWKELNSEGVECTVTFERKGNRIVLKTENQGIKIESTTTLLDDKERVYAAVTGDMVAITDIRVINGHT
ncbi:MAG: HD domain-containing protein [Lachnospiraceae bacterium]|nr:HD domain-containing protein [Lachnospiraceae bacterium]